MSNEGFDVDVIARGWRLLVDSSLFNLTVGAIGQNAPRGNPWWTNILSQGNQWKTCTLTPLSHYNGEHGVIG